MKNAKLTDKERNIMDTEYEKHKHDNLCPHTTNPLQLKQLCQRCVMLERLNINVYQMPQGDWGASSKGYISDGFKARQNAEEWAIKKHYPIKDKQGNYYRNIGAYIDLDT